MLSKEEVMVEMEKDAGAPVGSILGPLKEQVVKTWRAGRAGVGSESLDQNGGKLFQEIL